MTDIPASPQSFLSRWYWLVPYVLVSLLAITMLMMMAWMYDTLHKEHYHNAKNDIQLAERAMRLRLQVTEVFLEELARDMAAGQIDRGQFQLLANQHIANNHGLISIAWVAPDEALRWSAPYHSVEPRFGEQLSVSQRDAFYRARDLDHLTYGRMYEGAYGRVVLKVFMPVRDDQNQVFMGALVGMFSMNRVMRQLLPHWFLDKYQITLVDGRGDELLLNEGVIGARQAHSFDVSFPLPGNSLTLRATTLRTDDLWLWTPLLLALGLSLLVFFSLMSLRMYVKRRMKSHLERQRLFNMSLDILCTLDEEGVFRSCNPAFQRILGYTPDQLSNRSFFDIIHSEDIPRVKEWMHRLSAGEPVSFESRCRCADDTFKWLSWNINPVVAEQCFYVVAHDVTAHKNAEEAFRKESSFRHAMEDSIMIGMLAIDLEGRIVYVNRAFCNLLGFEEHELVGQSAPFPYWPPGMESRYRKRLELTMRGIMSRNGFELRIRRKDDTLIDAHFVMSPLIESDGKQTGWMGSVSDVTESKRVRAALEAAHAQFEAVLDGLYASVHVADIESDEILFANQTFKQLFGFNVVGRTVYDVGVPQAPLKAPTNLTAEMLPHKFFDGELQLPLSGRWFLVREHITRWVDGRLVRMSIATDVTERKQADDMGRQQIETLQHTSRLMTMGEMASTLAHEINQPLSAIANYCMGCVMRLQSGNFRQEDLLTAMQKASQQAERASRIIHRVREFVRKNESERHLARFDNIVENTLDLIELDAKRLNSRVNIDVPTDLPAVYVNPILIEQVLLNLIKNALDAMIQLPPAERVVTLQARLIDKRTVRVSVIDHGPGLAEEEREQLFSLFYTTKPGGMGMGLNICRSIIESHKGRLMVEANPEGGSIFSFTLLTEIEDEQAS